MTVYLVGAGPGVPDLLTVRAARLLDRADVVVYDRLIDVEVLALVNPLAQLIDVGKGPGGGSTQVAINQLLVTLGRTRQCIVRLKGGDPFVFGRGGEEFVALDRAGVACEIIPGVSSAFAAPLVAGIPVTQRGLSHGVTIVTGRSRDGATIDFRQLANRAITLVVLMGVARREQISRELREGGLAASTPVAVIERAYTAQQRITRGDLEELALLNVRAPAVIVVGAVAALALTQLRAVVASSSWSLV